MTNAASYRGRRSGRPVPLAPAPFDAGGGGGLFRILGDDSRVAKIFAVPCRIGDPLGRRLEAIFQKRLTNPHLVALDDLLVADADPDTLLGITMTRVEGHTHYSVTNPDERKLLGIALTPLDRICLALEDAKAFAAMHALHMRLGDAHHRNLMVVFDAGGRVLRVVLLEPDTWLFEWRTRGRMELFTSMARADFLPAEFQTADLTKTPLTFESDRFALALLVSLALFDCTPFAFAGSALTVEQRIKQGYEWIGPNLPPGATPPDRLPTDPATVPAEVMALLRKGVSRTPGERPTAAALATALDAWHKRALDAAAANRTVAALTALHHANTLAALRQRAVDALFAALRRFLPLPTANSRGGWFPLGVKAAVVLAVVTGFAVWAGGPGLLTTTPGEVPPPATRHKAAPYRRPDVWRDTFLELTDRE